MTLREVERPLIFHGHEAGVRHSLINRACPALHLVPLSAFDHRDQVINFVKRWAGKTELPAQRFVDWLEISSSEFYDWKAQGQRTHRLDAIKQAKANVNRNHVDHRRALK